MVSRTSCSHFACQGSYNATHTLGLNFTRKSWADWSLAPFIWVSLCMALTWSERNYCAWFVGTICEQPALVCHGPQLHFHRYEVSSPNRNLFKHVCKFETQFKFSVYGRTQTDIHTYASSNVVTPVWGQIVSSLFIKWCGRSLFQIYWQHPCMTKMIHHLLECWLPWYWATHCILH